MEEVKKNEVRHLVIIKNTCFEENIASTQFFKAMCGHVNNDDRKFCDGFAAFINVNQEFVKIYEPSKF